MNDLGIVATEGFVAYTEGKSINENPYYGVDRYRADQWHYGWCIAIGEDK